MILVIDNYDSFTYNLVQYVGELGGKVEVRRNDVILIKEINQLSPDYIIISPGPRTPSDAGISLEVINEFAGSIPILGVCLGHQAIAQAFGGNITKAQAPVHGKISLLHHDGQTIFTGIPQLFRATRYHSLIVESETLPACFEVTAWTDEGEIMGIRHKEFVLEGVQFHPESITTEYGKQLLKNFLQCYKQEVV